MSPRVQNALVASKQAAKALIRNASQDFVKDLDDVLDDPQNIGARVENLRDQLIDRGHVSARRAELIARDQTYKLNAVVTRAHHEDAGASSYWWSTSLDARVWPAHEDLEGQAFQNMAPPEPGNPGDDYNCRRGAIPVFDDDTEDDSDDDNIDLESRALCLVKSGLRAKYCTGVSEVVPGSIEQFHLGWAVS